MKVLTANRLIDGEVVFWKAGRWVERFADADLWEDGDEAAELAEAHGKTEITLVVEPYLIDIAPTGAPARPSAARSRPATVFATAW